MDSMINHYTANKKRRNDDAYSPGGSHDAIPSPRCATGHPQRRLATGKGKLAVVSHERQHLHPLRRRRRATGWVGAQSPGSW
jgi:hypothetical protein